MHRAVETRMTRQRQVILEELGKTTSHPTADQLHRRVRRRLPRISLATVYRNLEMLADRGYILRLSHGGGQRHFDGRTDAHYHIRCASCGGVGDLPLPRIASLEQRAAERTGWQVVGHDIAFVGVCPVCRKKEGTTPVTRAPADAATAVDGGLDSPT